MTAAELREAQARLGLSIAQMAELLGVSHTHFKRLMRDPAIRLETGEVRSVTSSARPIMPKHEAIIRRELALKNRR